MRISISLLGLVFICLVATPLFAQGAGTPIVATKHDSVRVIEKMNFTLTDVHGDDVNFKDFLGKGPLLLNFWALWCEPCKQEMKAFKAMAEKFKAEGVTMVAINEDMVRSTEKVKAYVSTQKLDFPVLMDPDGAIARDKFSMEQLPYSLLLMPNGTVYKRHIGYTAGDEAGTEKELTELLDKLAHPQN